MAQVNKEVREVFEEAVAIGQAVDKEKTRHRNAGARLMARAAENVYAAHLIEVIRPDGFAPQRAGAAGRQEATDAALRGVPLAAKAYAMLIGFSEAYISRLYRLGFGMAAGVLDPDAHPEPGEKTPWQLVSRDVGDTPEVAKVLGKEAKGMPTPETLQAAISAAQERKAVEREQRAADREAASKASWVPDRPSEQIGMMYELAEAIQSGRTLTPRQIERVRVVMDTLRDTIETWIEAHGEQAQSIKGRGKSIPRQREAS